VFSANTVDEPENYDLYIVFRRGRTWQDPVRMPGNLNTEKKEAFPTFYEDTLYYSSDGLAGMGGLDIFKTHPMQTPQEWSPPVNLEVPVNSGSDDFWLIVDPYYKSDGTVLQRGYFTSTRSTAGTSDDIYSFEKVFVEPPVVEAPPARVGKIYVEGTVYSRQYNDPSDPNSGQKALIPMPKANLAISTPDSVLRPSLSPKASFFMELEPDKEYEFVANRRGYLNNSYELWTTDEDLTGKPDKIYVVDIVLDPIFFNTEIVLENIYYDFDKWDIREDAMPTLDELSKLLKLNPQITIELGSHTDCRGNDQYNLELSQKRAQSAVDYMIAQGIDPIRLSARGYGETKPSAQCICEECTEEEHQQNRRTTFRILEG
jgi:outer membrane protein OmpA-like peptidoglycan-associated protein